MKALYAYAHQETGELFTVEMRFLGLAVATAPLVSHNKQGMENIKSTSKMLEDYRIVCYKVDTQS